MAEVKNYDGLVEELMRMMASLDAQGNQYQTDIYLYLSDEGEWRLDEYINIGGNSRLNDDHIWLYSDKPHYEDRPDFETDDVDEIAEQLLDLYGQEYREDAWRCLDDAGIE